MASPRALLTAALATELARFVAAAVSGTLDPATYAEPDDGSYWGTGVSDQAPFREERLKADELSRDSFDNRIMDGKVFVVEDAGRDWPMASWDCDYFRKDATFSKAEMNQQYTEGGGAPFVGFKDDWLKTRDPSGAKDKEAPQVAPFYWGIKDVQYPDAHRSRTWKKSMLRKVRENLVLPKFMHNRNLRSFNTTPEFWFAGPGAGAKAHMDSHVQATMSLQLAGTKRWRLSYMEPRRTAFLGMIFKDGDVYERPYTWRPHFNVTLRPGEALFFPPGFIHETLNVDEGEDSCAASVTFQFSDPFAVRLYRRFLPRVRRTPDIHEAWPLIMGWASLHGKSADKRGLGYRKARADALSENGAGKKFKTVDKDSDGHLSLTELEDEFGMAEAANMLGFHDLDEDGKVAREEFAETYASWAAITMAAIDETPKKYRKFQLEDMEGDFNIEDLPRQQMDALNKAAFEREAKQAKPEL